MHKQVQLHKNSSSKSFYLLLLSSITYNHAELDSIRHNNSAKFESFSRSRCGSSD